jgi:Domain of unknown function (DUF4864)
MIVGLTIHLYKSQISARPVDKSFQFGGARVSDGKIAQEVHIIDADGGVWEALYTLEQQPDGSVKITGGVLVKAAGTSV